MSQYYTECLDFFEVRYKVRLIPRANNLPRGNRNKITGAVYHTEGAVGNFPGNEDRTLFYWFSNPVSSYTHGYITFSGLYELYVPAENNCTGTGSADTNVQTIQTEFQDNARYNDNPPPYTPEQYETGARVYCAIKLFAKDKDGTDLKFEHGKGGLQRHADIDAGRFDCFKQGDIQKILKRSKQIWDEKFNSEDPNMIKELQEQVAKLEKANGEQRQTIETQNTRISDLSQSNEGLEIKLNSAITTQNELLKQLGVLQQEIEGLKPLVVEFEKIKKTIWYSFYFLFSKNERSSKGSIK